MSSGSGQTNRELDGLVLVDKPLDSTSFDVIRALRRITGIRKFGHAGTLDPKATGLLPVLVNRGTRLVEYLMGASKCYRATVELGASTDTLDTEGEITDTASVEHLSAAAVETAVRSFVGEIEQIPPRYSALRVDGKRAYDHARSGRALQLAPRRVTIDDISNITWEPPVVRFDIECGKGTYIRALARDIAAALEVPGHLAALRRLRVGAFRVDDGTPLHVLESAGSTGFGEHVFSLYEALRGCATHEVERRHALDIIHGRTHYLESLELEPGVYRVPVPETRQLLAVLDVEAGRRRPRVKVFAQPESVPGSQ